MNYIKIDPCDLNNGDGCRVVLWTAGCEHACKGCHNPETWNSHQGTRFGLKELKEIIDYLSNSYIKGITFSGGDPLSKRNRKKTIQIASILKHRFPEKDIWIWTGYCLAQLSNIDLSNFDVIVDGKYIEELKDPNLKLRGSSNQNVYKRINSEFKKIS
jgi:anaerobic ribonucleoside-triphosphate reductase activating protein